MADPHIPTVETRAKVDALASFGVPEKKIAKYIGIAYETLRKHYENELCIAGVDKIVQVANCLFEKCLEGNVPSMIFYLKTRAGWREYEKDELTDKEESISKIQIEVINGNGKIKDD